MNSVQTVTLNSALSQNWVGCIVRTPRTQVARTLRAVPMSWALLRTQQACRAHVALAARADRAHVGRALVATRPGSLPQGRDLTSMSRHQGSQNHVATSNRCRNTKPPPCSLNPVATSNRCRDTTQAYPGRDTKTRSPPSWRLPYVATSNSCRDTVFAHSGLSRSRHRNPCRDLPHCHPCCDIKSMSRRRFLLTKADQVATPLPGRDPTPNQTQSFPQPGRDTKRVSRHQLLQSSFCLAQNFFFPPVAFLLLPRCRSLNTAIHTTLNIFIKIILFNFLQFYPEKP